MNSYLQVAGMEAHYYASEQWWHILSRMSNAIALMMENGNITLLPALILKRAKKTISRLVDTSDASSELSIIVLTIADI
jgi:hypothetical protein